MKIKNGAARNTMSEFERQCYDWGWQDAETEILRYLKVRAEDLRACHKKDSCSDIAYVLEGCIEDIQENVDTDFQENLKSDLPDYHCPDCDDSGCMHCFCVEPTSCESCKEFAEKEQDE